MVGWSVAKIMHKLLHKQDILDEVAFTNKSPYFITS